MASSPPVRERAPMLADLCARLTPEGIVAAARGIEERRERLGDGLLVAHHGWRGQGLWTTAYMWQAAAVGAVQGVIAWDRQERELFEAPAAWVHPELGAAHYAIRRGAEAVQAPALWPFAQDATVADFDSAQPAKWWSHGVVHALIGFGHWAGLDEWQLMHMARLSEAVAAVHWYNLAELGRLTSEDVPIDLSNLRGEDAERYASLERAARRSASRRERLEDPSALRIAENALETLRYETFAYRGGMWDGDLLEPDDGYYLGLGEAAEYAKVHLRRLSSAAHARWREACLVAGRDFATSIDGFERRVAVVLSALVTPTDVIASDGRPRARRVLQDVGWRLCHLAALDGDEVNGHAAALRAVADGLAVLEAPAEVPEAARPADAIVADALDVARGALDEARAQRIFALGYRPTLDPAREPARVKEHRVRALADRGARLHGAVGNALDSLLPALRRGVSAPRDLAYLEGLTTVAEDAARAGEIAWEGYGYIGWLQMAWSLWFEPSSDPSRRWHYRLARRHAPDDVATWGDYVVAWNPYAKRMPLPWDARWNDELARAARGSLKRFKPRPATAVNYALMGPGRDGVIYLPLTPVLNALVQALKSPKTLAELAAHRDFGEEFMRRAVADEAVLIFHAKKVDRPERPLDYFEVAMAQLESIDRRPEPPGPWNEEDQADAYGRFCQRYGLYRDTSAALCDAAEIAPDAWVAELGVGTGETTAHILARLGAEGRVVGADPALLMLNRVRERFPVESRLEVVLGAGRAIQAHVLNSRRFDRIIANSSLALTNDIAAELKAVAAALAPGGRVAFSIPSEYVGDTEHLTSPEAARAFAAVDTARTELHIGAPVARDGADEALGSRENLERALTAAGFEDLRFVTYRRPWEPGEWLDWIDLPVVRKGMCGPADEARSAELIARVRELVPADLAIESVWTLVVGTRKADGDASADKPRGESA